MDGYFPPLIRQWLDDERNANNESIDTATKEAANISGASQEASAAAKGAEPVNRKERTIYNAAVRPHEENALQLWSQNNGLWISEYDFAEQYATRQIGAGAEQKVYLHENGREVVKVNTGTYHGNWLEFFNRLLCHAVFFPATQYSTVGFTSVDQAFAVVIQQQFALLTEGAPRSIVEPYLNRHGFGRTKNDDYYNSALGIILEDLHDENVFMLDGQILFIDPVIYFETTDMALDKNVLFRFPFS
jgi:Serine/Threonine/Tyrosine Kinase found in polyvalent proteins